MTEAVTTLPVSGCAIEAQAGAHGLRLVVEDGAARYSIELPDFVVLQMLRTVGQRGAQSHTVDVPGQDADVLVHPVQEWRVAQLDEQGTAAIQLTDVRGIGGAYSFDLEELEALYLVIGDLMARVRSTSARLRFN